jgi:hypothetical protein
MKVKILRRLIAEALRAPSRYSREKFEKLVQEAALHGLQDIARDGDYGYALEMISTLPNDIDRKALVAWYTHFSSRKLRFWTDKKSGVLRANIARNRQASDFDIEAAKGTRFTSCGPARVESLATADRQSATLAIAPKEVRRASPNVSERMSQHKTQVRASEERWRAARKKRLRRVLSGGRVSPR